MENPMTELYALLEEAEKRNKNKIKTEKKITQGKAAKTPIAAKKVVTPSLPRFETTQHIIELNEEVCLSCWYVTTRITGRYEEQFCRHNKVTKLVALPHITPPDPNLPQEIRSTHTELGVCAKCLGKKGWTHYTEE